MSLCMCVCTGVWVCLRCGSYWQVHVQSTERNQNLSNHRLDVHYFGVQLAPNRKSVKLFIIIYMNNK